MNLAAALPHAASRAWLGAAAACAGAVVLGWLAVHANLQRGCEVGDTPYLGLCAEDAQPPDPSRIAAQLREALARNPGDTAAYVQLAHVDRSAARPALVAAAASLAPNHPQVRMAQAVLALEQQDWNASVTALVEVVEHYPAITAPALALARMVGGGQADVMAQAIRPGSQWFFRVMQQLPQAGVPLAAALPLILRAHSQGVLDLAGARPYLRALKDAGQWGDAYALWLALRGNPASLLQNASFDQALETDGFDWETPGPVVPRAPVMLAQPAVPKRGVVLELSFNGRALPVPVLRQYAFLGEGRYRLHGAYRTLQLRTDQGLAWTIRCTSAPSRGSRSAPLGDTAGAWQDFEAMLDVPAACGPVVSLQLEPFAPAEAAAGIRGKLFFDDFRIEPVSRPAPASNRITPVLTPAGR